VLISLSDATVFHVLIVLFLFVNSTLDLKKFSNCTATDASVVNLGGHTVW